MWTQSGRGVLVGPEPRKLVYAGKRAGNLWLDVATLGLRRDHTGNRRHVIPRALLRRCTPQKRTEYLGKAVEEGKASAKAYQASFRDAKF